jgi:biotin synthase-related radical SAM superfamily protein
MTDAINPQHYQKGGVECIDAIEASMTEEAFKGFLKGNCIKYLYRYEDKNGVEDLNKAQWYLSRLIKMLCEDETKAKEELSQAWIERIPLNYDPDAYMTSGCPNGFRPAPTVRQGPPESISYSADKTV